MPELCTVVCFDKAHPPYRTGELAGFPHEQALLFVKHGFATIVRANVPRVDPATSADDAANRAEQLRIQVRAAEAEAEFHRAQAARQR